MGVTAAGRARVIARTGKFLRAWWPELLAAALLTAIGLAGQKDDPLFAAFVAIFGAIFWAMGRRHRMTPLRQTMEQTRDEVRAVRDILTDAPPDESDDDGRPHLSVVR